MEDEEVGLTMLRASRMKPRCVSRSSSDIVDAESEILMVGCA